MPLMSTTDPQLHQKLPSLRISVVEPSNRKDGVSVTIVQSQQAQPDIDDESCRTPTSEESKIPATLTCPPAPQRKPSLKRKLSEPDDKVKVIKVLRKDQLEALFRSIVPPSPHKLCRCHRCIA